MRLDISDTDDGSESAVLPFLFPWPGGDSFRTITIGANGLIILGGGDTSSVANLAGDFPIAVGGAYAVPRIAVAQADLDPESSGEIYASTAGSSFVVSWEGASHWNQENTMNFQVALFPNGAIEVRWGEGDLPPGKSIVSGVEDDGLGITTPATGAPFEAGGQTQFGVWPSNQCRRFERTGAAMYVEQPTIA